MKIVMLYSGGVDSYTLYHYIKNTYPDAYVKALYYDFGQHYSEWEIKNLPDFVEVRSVPWLQYDKTVHVNPCDNGIMWGREQFLTVAAFMQEKPDMICLGVLHDEWGEDMSPEHQQATQTFLSGLNPYGIECEVSYPFAELGWSKNEVVKWAVENNVDVTSTRTCMNSEDPCGFCPGCIKRKLMFCYHGLIPGQVELSKNEYESLCRFNKDYISILADMMTKGLLHVIPHDREATE